MKIITIYHYISRLLLLFLFLFTGLYTYGQVKIGENKTKISPYALLELESKDKALLVPRMTTAERDEAFSQESPEGLVIFNTDIGMIQYFFQDIDPLTGKKLNIKRWNSTGEEVHTSFPVTPRSGTLFYNEDSNILFAWNDNDKLWMPVNANIRSSITENGVSDPSIDTEFEAFPPSENGKESLKEVLMGSGPPTTTIMKDNPSGMLYADSDRGSLYMALDTDNDGTPDKWKKIIVKSDPKPVDPPSDDQTIAARLNGLVLELLPENTTISTTVDLSSLVTQSTDDQSITATLSDTILKLTPENSNTTEVDLGVFTNTDNQKLSLTLLPNTTTQTLLQIENGGSVTLQASGNLYFREPKANVIEFTVSSTVSTLGDSDGNTKVELEKTPNDDTIRLIAAGEEVTQVTSTTTTISNTVVVTKDLEVKGESTFTQTVTLLGGLLDRQRKAGEPGQVLTSTGSQTEWQTPEANTDTQTLGITFTNTKQASLTIVGGNALSLQASGNLSFREPRANVIEFTVSSTVSTLGDSDGNTTIEVDQGNNNDNTIRLIAGGVEVTQVTSTTTTISNTVVVTKDLEVKGESTFTQTVTLLGGLLDGQRKAGEPGQVLTSTGSQTEWQTPEANTDSQTLGITFTNTKQASLTIVGGNALSLQASGNLYLSAPSSNVIKFTVSSTVSTLGDSDGNTTIEVDQGNNNDNTIRLIAAGEEVTQVTSTTTTISNTVVVTKDLEVKGESTFTQTVTLLGGLQDGQRKAGEPGQVLTSTGSQTEWQTPEANTDSQTLGITFTNTKQASLTIVGGNALSLQASGNLSFEQMPDGLTLTVSESFIIDQDRDTSIEVDKGNNDDDTIRFNVAGTEVMSITSNGIFIEAWRDQSDVVSGTWNPGVANSSNTNHSVFGFRKLPFGPGMVAMKGSLDLTNSVLTGDDLFTLPVDYRPPLVIFITITTQDQNGVRVAVRLAIRPNGNVQIKDAARNNINLDGTYFFLD